MGEEVKLHELNVYAKEGRTDEVKRFLGLGKLPTHSDKCERALITAVQFNKIDCIRALLEFGVSASSRIDGQIAICVCAEKNYDNAAKLLLAYKADYTVKTSDGMNALTIAVKKMPPALDVVKELLRAGAKVSATDQCGGLAAVVKEVNIEMLANELKKMADVDIAQVQADIAAADKEVWKHQREHMRLLIQKEEQKAGVLVIHFEKETDQQRAESRVDQKSEDSLAHDLNEVKVVLQSVTADTLQLIKDLDEAESAEAKMCTERDVVATELAGQQGFVKVAVDEMTASDRLRVASEKVRDEALAQTAEMETEFEAANKHRDLLNSELRDAEKDYKQWMRAKEQAASLTAQAQRLLATN